MKTKKIFTISFIYTILLFNLSALAKNDSYYYQNAVYNDKIKSVQFFNEENELSVPVIELGSETTLLLKFDALSEDANQYSYTIIHCDANWNESYIQQLDYLNGFADNPLDDYAMSFNTTVKYVNYQLSIPNENCSPKISGNYALVVFEGNDREKLVLIQRFYVVEPLVRIEGLVKKATFDPYNGDNQEVDFKIYHERLRLSNPRDDIKVVLMQNRRWDNAIRNLKPLFIKENMLDYDYNKENVFPGGNEFRYFDLRSIRHNGENVQDIQFIRPYYHVTLMPDQIRNGKEYFFYKEMNGQFVIESQERVTDYDTECDYAFVHFFLPVPTQLVGGSVNVFGAMTGWNANQSNEMKYNFQQGGYEATLLLKHGYYNYQYVYVPQGAQKADAANLEGTHFETENEYQIFAYYRDMSGRYDRLVGYTNITTLKR